MGATKESAEERTVPRILVVGGGYVGMYTALRLQQKLKLEPGGRSRAQSRVKSWAKPRSGAPEAEIVIVTAQPYMTYQPFLPEAAAGSISPRHVVVPLR